MIFIISFFHMLKVFIIFTGGEPLARKKDGQPFNKNMLRPCPMLENPNLLRDMVKQSKAHSTDILEKESADHLCDKCEEYAENWRPVADEIWAESGK